MEPVIRSLRHAVRNLMRTPGFALVTIATLALGIGANTAIFSVVNGVLLRPLAYPRPVQLVYISSQFSSLGFDQFWVSPPEFLDFRDWTKSFSAVGAFSTGQGNLTTPDRPQRVNVARASAELFKVLGVAPYLGRTFEPAETLPNGPPVVVLSYETWQSSFGGDRGIIGRRIEVNGTRPTVVGVMPPRFDVADQRVELYLPLAIDPAARGNANRGSHYLYLIGRLADGSTLTSARAELETLLAGWQRSLTGSDRPPREQRLHTPNTTTHRLRFDPLQAQIVGGARTAVWVLQGAVLFVLLIACANLANLLLARAESRHKEFAVRSALGASRGRLLAQFMTEGCLLSVTGAAVGIGLAIAGIRALVTAFPDSLPRSGNVGVDAGVLVFTLAVALATGLVFGLAPLLHLASDVTSVALKEGGQRSTAAAGRHRLRRVLVVGEIALSVALVIGAGLLLRTVLNLTKVDAGFNRGRLATFLIAPPRATYADPQQVVALYQRLVERLKGQPAVQNVAAMTGLPPLRQVDANDTKIEGYVRAPDGPMENVDYYQTATAGYVETLGIPVVEGRAFQPIDENGAPVVMINETMARTFYAGQDPIGRRVRPCCGNQIPWFTIVGVLKDVKQGGVDRKTGTELYFDFEQLPHIRGFASVGDLTPNTLNVVLRTSLPVDALSGPVHDAVNAIDRTLPVVKLRTIDDVFAEAIGRPRLLADLLGIFAALALLLAAIGSYGVLSYMVTERRREIGIRMALGADRASVRRMVLMQGLRLTVAGVVIGLAMALGVNRLLVSLLFGVRPADPATLAGVVVLIAGVGLVACYMPAHGATRVDPMVVLRED